VDAKQFREAVQLMRSLQKEYFRHRDPVILVKAKSAEKTVDDYLSDRQKEENSQQKLF
jgi:hypothetical protein